MLELMSVMLTSDLDLNELGEYHKVSYALSPIPCEFRRLVRSSILYITRASSSVLAAIFKPDDKASRNESVAIIVRMLNKIFDYKASPPSTGREDILACSDDLKSAILDIFR